MKYPYIGKGTVTGVEVLLTSGSCGFALNNECLGTPKGKFHDDWDENIIKNITREYLANTYGKVESKEHAEFLIEIAIANELNIHYETLNRELDYFAFKNDGSLYFFDNESHARMLDRKLITIPLPPKQLAPTGSKEEDMKNNGDNLIFAGEDKCKEWPCVGSKVTWGKGAVNGIVKCVDGKQAWISLPDNYHATISVERLQKPKTPEEELRDEIADLAFNQFNGDSYDLTHNSHYLAEQLLSKYNITKKPQ